MSRSLERRKRQDNRAQRRSQGSVDAALTEQLDLLGKRTMAQVEGAARRGFANLGQLPQQIFSELETSLGELDTQPRVKLAVGKLTEVIEAAADLKPLHLDDIAARDRWVPEDVEDTTDVADRERHDRDTNRSRLQLIAKVANTNETQEEGGERRGNPLARKLRGVMGNFELAASVTETITNVGVVGFEKGAAAATAAIGGSLQDLLRAASEALGAKELPVDPATAPASDINLGGELAPQPRGEVAEPTADAKPQGASEATDELAREHDEEEQAAGDEESVALEEPGMSAAVMPSGGMSAAVMPSGGMSAAVMPGEGMSAAVMPGEGMSAAVMPSGGMSAAVMPGEPGLGGLSLGGGVQIGLGGAQLSVDGNGVALSGEAGSMRVGPGGLSGSLSTRIGNLRIGTDGASADLAAGGASLHVSGSGVQLGVQTDFGSLRAGTGGLELITAAGSVRAGQGGVQGHLEQLGTFSGPAMPANAGVAAQVMPPGAGVAAQVMPPGAGVAAQVMPPGAGVAAQVMPPGLGLDGMAARFGDAITTALAPARDAVAQVGGMIHAAVEKLGTGELAPSGATGANATPIAGPNGKPAGALAGELGEGARGDAGHKVTAALGSRRDAQRTQHAPQLDAASPAQPAAPSGKAPTAQPAPPAASGDTPAQTQRATAIHELQQGPGALPAAPSTKIAATGLSSPAGAPTPAAVAVEQMASRQRTISRDGRSEVAADPAALRDRSAPQAPRALGPSAPTPLQPVPLQPVPRPAGPVTQPDMQISARGDSPPTPTADALTAPPAQAPTLQPASTSVAASDLPAPTAAPRPAPAPLPKATGTAAIATTGLAAARAQASQLKIAPVGGAQLPTGTTPELSLDGGAPRSAQARTPVALQPATIEAAPQQPVPTIPAAANQTAAPETPTTTATAPEIPAAIPASSGMPSPTAVQSTVSLGKDRENAALQLDTEERSQRKLPPAADKQRAAEIDPLGPELMRQVPTIEEPARTKLVASSDRQTAAVTSAGDKGLQSVTGDGLKEQQQHATRAAAHRAGVAQQPPPGILAATGPNTVTGPLQQGQSLVATAIAAGDQRPAPNLATPPQLGAVAARAAFGPLDQGTFAEIDAPRELPQLDPNAATTATAALTDARTQNRAALDAARDVPAPQIQVPARSPAEEDPQAAPAAPGQPGQPKARSRAAAIAEIEAEVGRAAQEQAPAQMSAAAGQLATEYQGHADQAMQQSQDQLTGAQQQAQAQAAQIEAQPPPYTAAAVGAEAEQHWSQGEAQAQAASAEMGQEVSTAQATAQSGLTAAQASRAAAVQAAQAAQQAENAAAQTGYQAQHQAAQQGFQAQDAAAQQAMAAQQAQAQVQAQSRQAQAQAQSATEQAQAQSQHAAQEAQAQAQHQTQVAAEQARGQAEQQRITEQGNQQVTQRQQELQRETNTLNQRGQQQVAQITNDGEQRYQQRMQQGQREAEQRRAQGESEAAAKRSEAESQNSGGLIGAALNWVKARIGELMAMAEQILEAARAAVISILNAARDAAMALLDAARKAALDALNSIKQLIQGAIQAAAAAVRSIISAVANLVRQAIQALASALQTLVRTLTQALTQLVQAFQRAVNAILDALIKVVSLINKDLGQALQQATQKYRDAFNNACNQLQTKIQAAGQALEQNIQRAADRAIAAVDQAEQTLNNAVTQVENQLNEAVEAAYQKGVEMVNRAYDAAKAKVEELHQRAVEATNRYFDEKKRQLHAVKDFIDKAIDGAIEVVKKIGEAVSMWAKSVVDLVGSTLIKGFVDFWNGPWRNAIIIGLATIVAVAVTVGTGGVGGPVAAVLLASLIGGTLAGGATLAGDALARQGTIELAERGEGIYVPGHGPLKLGPDGQPDLSGIPEDKREEVLKNMQWSLSNFDQASLRADANGMVTGTGKSHEEIGQMSMDAGAIAFVEGAVSSGLAAVGGLGGNAIAGRVVGKVAVDATAKQVVSHTVRQAVVSSLVNVPVNVLSAGSTQAVNQGLTLYSQTGDWEKAKQAAGNAFVAGVTDPATWGSSLLAVPGSAATARISQSAMSPLLRATTETLIETAADRGGSALFSTPAAYFQARAQGLSHEQALAAAQTKLAEEFSVGNIVMSGGMTAAGKGTDAVVDRFKPGQPGAGLPEIPRDGTTPTIPMDGGSTRPVDTSAPDPAGTTRPVDTAPTRPVDTAPTRPVDTAPTRPVSAEPARPVDSSVPTTRPVDTTPTRPVDTAPARPVDPTPVTTRPVDTTRPSDPATRPVDGGPIDVGAMPDSSSTRPVDVAVPVDTTPTRPVDTAPTRPVDTTPTRPVDTAAPDTTRPVDSSVPTTRPVDTAAPDTTRPVDANAPLDPNAPRPDTAAPPPPEMGAVKGQDVYATNTRVDKDGNTVPVYLNSEKAGKGLKPLASSGRTYGPDGSVSNVKVTEVTNSAGRKVPEATLSLDLPAQNGQPAAKVAVEIKFLPPTDLTPTSVHGDDAGPARFSVTQDSSGQWRAQVEVDGRVRHEDLPFILGHELAEVGFIVRDNPGGVPQTGLSPTMSPGVLADGSTQTTPTAHDRAAAQEAAALANDLSRLQTSGAKQDTVTNRQATLDAALEAGGWLKPGNVDAKLKLLTEAGAPPALIDRVQLAESGRVLDAELGPGSNLSPEAVQHLLFPAHPTGGFSNGISGGHETSRVKEFGGAGTPYGFVEVASTNAGGTTVRQFDQYKWNGSGDKPLPGSGRYPGEANFDPADWTRSSQPKTTVDDIGPYLQEVNGALDTWYAQNGTAIPADRKFSALSPNGMRIEGFFEPNPGPDGKPVVRTAYVDATWLAQNASAQSATTPQPTPQPSSANPTMVPEYAVPRNERAREPNPVTVGDQSYDVMGMTPDGQLLLRPEGVITRNVPVENLYGRTVEHGGQPYTIAAIDPASGGGVSVRLVSVADPSQSIVVSGPDAKNINLRFPGGTPMQLGDWAHGVVRLQPAGEVAQTTAPLAPGQQFEARLRGRELDGVYTVRNQDGQLIATGRDRDGNVVEVPIQPTDIAPRYVDVQSANFDTPHQRSAFDVAEDRIKRTAETTGDTGMPISDPLLGTLADQPNSQVLNGVDSLAVQDNFIIDRAAPGADNPNGRGRDLTVFNIVFNNSGEAKRVLDAMVEFRRQNPEATIRLVVANTESRPATDQTRADEAAMRQTMADHDIELVLYAGGLKPDTPQGEDRMVIHAKGVMVDGDVMFTTAGVIDPSVKNKMDVTTELPPEAARAFRQYFDEAVTGNASVERRQELAAELAAQGVLVSDPVAQLPYIARANDALIRGAKNDLYINTSELRDLEVTQKIIDQVANGVEVKILARDFDPRALEMLRAAQAQYPDKLTFGQPDNWDPRPHYNVIIADGVQAYVGTAYLWPNQQSNVQHARSFENGVLLQGDRAANLRAQLDAHEASAQTPSVDATPPLDPSRMPPADRIPGNSGDSDYASTTPRDGNDPNRAVSDPTRDLSDPSRDASDPSRDPAGDRSLTVPREPQVPTRPLTNREAVTEQLAHGMVARDLTPADIEFLRLNGYEAGPILRGKREFVMRVFTSTNPDQPSMVSFRGTVPSKVQTLIADLDPSGIGMYQWNANRDLITAALDRASANGKVVVSGHSLGGALAQITAAMLPDKVHSVTTFQAPGVTQEMAQRLRDYNQANPDAQIESTHHRVLGDLVPRGGETLTDGTLHNYTMTGGNWRSNNVLSRHLASPLSQLERADGNRLPTQDQNEGIGFTYEGRQDTATDTIPGGPIETVRRVLGTGVFAVGGLFDRLRRLFGGGNDQAPPGSSDPFLAAMTGADHVEQRTAVEPTPRDGDATTPAMDPAQTPAQTRTQSSIKLEDADAMANAVVAAADADLLALAAKVDPKDPQGAIRAAVIKEAFELDRTLGSTEQATEAVRARLGRMHEVTEVDWSKPSDEIAGAHPERGEFEQALRGLVPPEKIAQLWQLVIDGVKFQKGLNEAGTKHNPNPHYRQLAAELATLLRPRDGGQPALWSGGIDVSIYARAHGYATLENTSAGELFNQLKLFRDFSTLGPLWNAISRKFVESFGGDVHVFVRTMDKGSVLFRQELAELVHLDEIEAVKWHVMKGTSLMSLTEIDRAGAPAPGYTFDGFRDAATVMDPSAIKGDATGDGAQVHDQMVREQGSMAQFEARLHTFVEQRAAALGLTSEVDRAEVARIAQHAEIRLKNDPALEVALADLYAEIQDDVAKDLAHLARQKSAGDPN